MRQIKALIVLMLVVAFASSCGTTTYRGRKYKSNKYIGYKKHWHFWHAHHYKPRQHAGGYW